MLACQWVLTFPFSWRRRLAQDGAWLGRLTRIFVETVPAFTPSARRSRVGASGRPARSPWCRGRRPICGSTHISTRWCSTAPGTSRAASLSGRVSGLWRPARWAMFSSACSGVSRSTFAAAACSGSTTTALSRAGGRSREPPRCLSRFGPGAACRAPVGVWLGAARAARVGVRQTVMRFAGRLHTTRGYALDPTGREARLRYVLRPPIAQEPVEQRPDGLVRMALEKA